jgi:hypothetical protein
LTPISSFLEEPPHVARFGIVVYPGNEMAEIRWTVWAVQTGICQGQDFFGKGSFVVAKNADPFHVW